MDLLSQPTTHISQCWVGKFARRSRRTIFLTGLLLSTVTAGSLFIGCAAPRQWQPTVNPSELSDVGFQAYLSEAPMVTVDEAYRAMLILADGEDNSANFDERKQKLESRGIARSAWGLQPENVIDTGSVAFMVCRICQIHGGINMNLFGSWGLGDRRYALRELVYREVMDEAVHYEYVSGPAMAAILRRADTLMEQRGLYPSQGVNLSDETDRDAQGNLIVPPPVTPENPPTTTQGS